MRQGWLLLPASFYARDTTQVAKELLGTYMVYHSPQGTVGGKIVETEAYLGAEDPACHSARGKTRRNAVMFGEAGHAYIYQIYGIHYCFNVTTDRPEVAAAVLIRALEPVIGIELMKARRGQEEITKLCSGPAKLVQAMGIPPELNGTSVVEGPVKFYRDKNVQEQEIVTTTRIGISKAVDWPLRFYLAGNPHVSKK
ncbi:DNA-3-methyladenine glycosylase [Calderihabitans maritimus]|uniref:Putative 3-methyladenine DNA glycosylase n=1 Tax=Calderihabitans maritimus TaxID=1246530 RepID=A0A1Z5HS52_9FIRM|nr:DNA-3-methyladenine glycosylase [Calderihabitans maritimus]GAW92268.1 hypothetical protein KKC1_14240 [Calderihabitans maritimus]